MLTVVNSTEKEGKLEVVLSSTEQGSMAIDELNSKKAVDTAMEEASKKGYKRPCVAEPGRPYAVDEKGAQIQPTGGLTGVEPFGYQTNISLAERL